jgi:hypothetical protein
MPELDAGVEMEMELWPFEEVGCQRRGGWV